MPIEKKSLISTLKTTKKANIAASKTGETDAKGAKVASMRYMSAKQASAKQLSARAVKSMKTASAKQVSAKSVKSMRLAANHNQTLL
jgi:hypothetical protein